MAFVVVGYINVRSAICKFQFLFSDSKSSRFSFLYPFLYAGFFLTMDMFGCDFATASGLSLKSVMSHGKRD